MDVREKLVEFQNIITCPNTICNFCEHFKNNNACEKHKKEVIADNMIASGVTVQQWIPVSSPPKKPGDYLCYFKYEPESPNIICQNTYYGSGRWMSEPDKVTHWAYLPLPPKGE